MDLASGPLTNSAHGFIATLDRYANGQCITCGYRPPQLQGNDGVMSILFQTEYLATVNR